MVGKWRENNPSGSKNKQFQGYLEMGDAQEMKLIKAKTDFERLGSFPSF